MATPWEQDDREECWGDREAWRGDRHVEAVDVEAWRRIGEADLVWCEPEPEEELAADEEWPEHLAGPEYWLFKQDES